MRALPESQLASTPDCASTASYAPSSTGMCITPENALGPEENHECEFVARWCPLELGGGHRGCNRSAISPCVRHSWCRRGFRHHTERRAAVRGGDEPGADQARPAHAQCPRLPGRGDERVGQEDARCADELPDGT